MEDSSRAVEASAGRFPLVRSCSTCQLCERAAAATEIYEATEAEISALTASPSLELRVGRHFLKYTKDKDVADLLHGWDSNNDGVVDISEAVAGMRACGVKGPDDELKKLAKRWDANQNGTLEFDELKEAIDRLMEARIASDESIKELRARLSEEGNLAALRQRALSSTTSHLVISSQPGVVPRRSL